MKANCQYPDCTVSTAQPSGRGRPRKWCAEHAKVVKREQDRGRLRGTPVQQFTELLRRDCCADAKRANPRVRKCPQHKQWTTFLYQTRKAIAAHTVSKTNDAKLADVSQSMPGAFSVAQDPDSWMAGKEAGDYENDRWIQDHKDGETNTSSGTGCPDELAKAA
jgi:hypothetical protein